MFPFQSWYTKSRTCSECTRIPLHNTEHQHILVPRSQVVHEMDVLQLTEGHVFRHLQDVVLIADEAGFCPMLTAAEAQLGSCIRMPPLLPGPPGRREPSSGSRLRAVHEADAAAASPTNTAGAHLPLSAVTNVTLEATTPSAVPPPPPASQPREARTPRSGEHHLRYSTFTRTGRPPPAPPKAPTPPTKCDLVKRKHVLPPAAAAWCSRLHGAGWVSTVLKGENGAWG